MATEVGTPTSENGAAPTPTKRWRFFDAPKDETPPGAVRAAAAPYGTARSMAGAAEVLNLNLAEKNRLEHSVQAWQESAWNYVDQIGELKFAFNIVSQVVSRAMLYPAILGDLAEVPTEVGEYLEQTKPEVPDVTLRAADVASEVLTELLEAGQAEMLRLLAVNLSVPGECYLLKDTTWTIASTSELTPGTITYLNRSKKSELRRAIPKDTYVARLWRAHPRWYNEPDSSMLGVLDQCEKVVLFDQAIRALTRSRLGAGIVAIPSGLTPLTDGLTVQEALAKATVDPVESEAAAASVVPLLLTGPAEQIKELQRIDLSRPLEEPLLMAYDSALDRMLAGLDIPKNIVTGLADVKYSNALVIDDALYKAHIEPLLLLICDCLTNAYLRPRLRKEGVDEKLVKRMVVWYNPSQIVTRPDRSQAASEGYEKMLLSGKAWRAARGFAETDAPDDDEIIWRKGLDAQVPGEMATVLIEQLHPEFFAKLRQAGRQEAGVPPEVSDILDGGTGTADNGLGGENNTPSEPGQVPAAKAPNDPMAGGEIQPGGTLPPRPTEEILQ